MSLSRLQLANQILSVEKFLDFIERFMRSYESSSRSKIKFASLNPEVINLLLGKISVSKNKNFREKLEKGPLIRKTIQGLTDCIQQARQQRP